MYIYGKINIETGYKSVLSFSEMIVGRNSNIAIKGYELCEQIYVKVCAPVLSISIWLYVAKFYFGEFYIGEP